MAPPQDQDNHYFGDGIPASYVENLLLHKMIMMMMLMMMNLKTLTRLLRHPPIPSTNDAADVTQQSTAVPNVKSKITSRANTNPTVLHWVNYGMKSPS